MDQAYIGLCLCLLLWHAGGTFEECAPRMGAVSVVYLFTRIGLAFLQAWHGLPPDAAVFCVVPVMAAVCAYMRPQLAVCLV
jgi:hypothetical protein